jgi:DNA repair protein RecO (recombination protein O)
MARAAGPLAAYVLHHYDWSESSLILDLFTREQGRVVVAARGAKKPHSNFRAALLPFQRLSVGFGRSDAEGEVQTLRAAEFAGGSTMPRGGALLAGFYLNELLIRLLARQDPHPVLFDAYGQTLPRLELPDEAGQAALRAFELVLLRETGLLPELSVETSTQRPVVETAGYRLLPDAGVEPADSDAAALDGVTLAAVQDALDAGSLDELQAACLRQSAALKAQLRPLLHYHLGTPALRSRQLMVDLQPLLE